MILQSRQIGRSHRARALAARRKLHDAQLKHADTLTASEVDRQDRELSDWINQCEQAGEESLRWAARFIGGAVDSASSGYGTSKADTRYVDLRMPFLEYAREALGRRFPTPLESEGELTNDCF